LRNARPCPQKGRAGSVYTPYDATIGRRIAMISSALRCKWEKVQSWTCSSCLGVPSFKVLTAYEVPTADPDGFIVSFDQQLNAVVLTFRSTYCARSADCFSLQWLNNLNMVAKTISLPTGSYKVHAGIHNTWANDFKGPVLKALKDAFALHPASSHNGLYVTGHSRGGGFATVAAVDLYFEAANLGLTTPTEQIKLYTMGGLRVGDASYASLVESLLTTRFRIVTNADIVTAMPPAKVQWIEDLLYLLGDFGRAMIKIGNEYNFYRHFGPVVLNVDVVPNSLSFIKVCPLGECPDCAAASLLTLGLGRSWADSVFTRMFLDHQWYFGADMDNANCKLNGKRYDSPVIYA
jgi:Lipase (class 3)